MNKTLTTHLPTSTLVLAEDLDLKPSRRQHGGVAWLRRPTPAHDGSPCERGEKSGE